MTVLLLPTHTNRFDEICRYGSPVYWTRDDDKGVWHPTTDYPPNSLCKPLVSCSAALVSAGVAEPPHKVPDKTPSIQGLPEHTTPPAMKHQTEKALFETTAIVNASSDPPSQVGSLETVSLQTCISRSILKTRCTQLQWTTAGLCSTSITPRLIYYICWPFKLLVILATGTSVLKLDSLYFKHTSSLFW